MFCRLNQWRISSALTDGRNLPARVRGHVQRCSACRTFHRDSLALEQRLRSEPATGAWPAPAIATGGGRRWAVAASALAAAAVVVLGLFLWTHLGGGEAPTRQDPPPRIAQQHDPTVPAALFNPSGAAAQSAGALRSASESMGLTPEALVVSARSAGEMLLSYLPKPPPQPTTMPADPATR